MDAEKQRELFKQVTADFTGNGFNFEFLDSLENNFGTICSLILVKFNEAARQKEKDFSLAPSEIGTLKDLCYEILRGQRDQRHSLSL